MATTLTSGNAALAGTTIVNTNEPLNASTMADTEQADQGFIILETNYKIYAYTGKIGNHEQMGDFSLIDAYLDSPLQIAVLNLFVQLQSRFRNMVTGLITRDSIRNALMKGITAEQVRKKKKWLTIFINLETRLFITCNPMHIHK